MFQLAFLPRKIKEEVLLNHVSGQMKEKVARNKQLVTKKMGVRFLALVHSGGVRGTKAGADLHVYREKNIHQLDSPVPVELIVQSVPGGFQD